jgi:hypothetical protein
MWMQAKAFLVRFLKRILEILNHPSLKKLDRIQDQVQASLLLLADARIETHKIHSALRLTDAEFRVFSQWGEDGIIQYLISRVPIENNSFIEFGVEDYRESNTRFLLIRDNWSGLVIDGSAKNVEKIKKDDLYWRYDLTALCAFITRDNINELIRKRFHGDIGILSIDVDGNDYWIWEAIDVVSPRIVICEYNSIFGVKKAVSVPYNPAFYRTEAHFSNLYFGASLPALCNLASRKGYVFVGCTKAGNDAFFVRNDVANNVMSVTAREGYILSKSRESRNESGQATFISGDERLGIISDMEVFDFERTQLVKVSTL